MTRSIVARAAFVRELDRLSADGGVPLPKGSGAEAKRAAIELIERLDGEAHVDVAAVVVNQQLEVVEDLESLYYNIQLL